MLPDTERLAAKMKEEYKVPVLPINIESMQEKDMYGILKEALYEFPIEQIKVNMPEWIAVLNPDNYIKAEYITKIKEAITEVNKLKDIDKINNNFTESEYISKSYISEVDPATGEVTINRRIIQPSTKRYHRSYCWYQSRLTFIIPRIKCCQKRI